MDIALFVIGLVLLVVGAEVLVKGASAIAVGVGISPLVVGLTVVAFGTSAPEMAVAVGGGLQGKADLALGNIVGSNIFNVLFVLGICALLAPLVVQSQLIRLDVPLTLVISLVVFGMALDGTIGRIDGALLFAGLLTYTGFVVRASRKESAALQEEFRDELSLDDEVDRPVWLSVLFVLVGVAMLVGGSQLLLDAAVAFAEALGVSELVIGLTVVAAGTSMPEVATSVMATIRGERDIAIGNVVGSSIFNLLGALGLVGLVTSGGVPVDDATIAFDLPVMVAVALACVPIFFSGYAISRWEGGVFFGYYLAFTAYLVLRAQEHDALDAFSNVMLLFVLPLTVLTLAATAVQAYRAHGWHGPDGRGTGGTGGAATAS